MKRCRCRSRLLPTTRIGTSLLLHSLRVHERDVKREWMNGQNMEVQLSPWCQICQGVCKMPVSIFPLQSEVCGGGREDYCSQTRGASHHTLQWLLYSIITSVNRRPEICIDKVSKIHAINSKHIQCDTLKGPLREILDVAVKKKPYWKLGVLSRFIRNWERNWVFFFFEAFFEFHSQWWELILHFFSCVCFLRSKDLYRQMGRSPKGSEIIVQLSKPQHEDLQSWQIQNSNHFISWCLHMATSDLDCLHI